MWFQSCGIAGSFSSGVRIGVFLAQRCLPVKERQAHLDVAEERDEQRAVLLLVEGHAARAVLRPEAGRPGDLQRIQAALQELLRVLVLARRPGAGSGRAHEGLQLTSRAPV